MRLLSKTRGARPRASFVDTLLRLGALAGALALGACSSSPEAPVETGPSIPAWSIPDGGVDYGPKVDPLAYGWVNAVAYSGYRNGQSPNTDTYPTSAQSSRTSSSSTSSGR